MRLRRPTAVRGSDRPGAAGCRAGDRPRRRGCLRCRGRPPRLPQRTSSIRLTWGMAKRSPPLVTTSAGMMARVRGILIFSSVPLPAALCRSTVPPIFSMLVLTTSMPTPRPEMLLTCSAVEKPGGKGQVQELALRHARGMLGGDHAFGDGLGLQLFGGDAGAVVGDLDVDLAALVEGAQQQMPVARLAGAPRAPPAFRCRGPRHCG